MQEQIRKPTKQFRIKIIDANIFAQEKVLQLIKRASEVFEFKYEIEGL